MMVKRYKIVYTLNSDPHTIRSIWKFGTNCAEIEKSLKSYINQPFKIVEIEITDDED